MGRALEEIGGGSRCWLAESPTEVGRRDEAKRVVAGAGAGRVVGLWVSGVEEKVEVEVVVEEQGVKVPPYPPAREDDSLRG